MSKEAHLQNYMCMFFLYKGAPSFVWLRNIIEWGRQLRQDACLQHTQPVLVCNLKLCVGIRKVNLSKPGRGSGSSFLLLQYHCREEFGSFCSCSRPITPCLDPGQVAFHGHFHGRLCKFPKNYDCPKWWGWLVFSHHGQGWWLQLGFAQQAELFLLENGSRCVWFRCSCTRGGREREHLRLRLNLVHLFNTNPWFSTACEPG